MSELQVRIVRLEPMRMASAHGFGASPEEQAFEKIGAYAKGQGLDLGAVRSFGFNNPDPSPSSPNYGYDVWITVGPDVEGEGEVEIKEFPGGLYAVARCKGVTNIGEVWRRLVTWCEDSHYRKAHHQWLEELLTPADVPHDEYVFDLYLPVAE
jgi:DNA gyrase inhibitor GyrI